MPAEERFIDEVTAEDLEAPAGFQALNKLVEKIKALPEPHAAVPALMRLFERLDQVDLGTPGPLVGYIEDLGGYEDELERSLGRKPTFYTLWMANRIANDPAAAADSGRWLRIFERVVNDRDASENLREFARDFLSHHGLR